MDVVRKLSYEETIKVTIDSKVVAIRWDLKPWGLVLDLDARFSENPSAPLYRAWVIFDGVSELSWPLDNTRLPNGCGLTSEIMVAKESNNFRNYSVWGLLPSFDATGSVLEPVSKLINIKAQEVIGVCSVKQVKSSDGCLDRKQRLELATDDDLLSLIL